MFTFFVSFLNFWTIFLEIHFHSSLPLGRERPHSLTMHSRLLPVRVFGAELLRQARGVSVRPSSFCPILESSIFGQSVIGRLASTTSGRLAQPSAAAKLEETSDVCTEPAAEEVVVEIDEAKAFLERCLQKVRVSPSHAQQLADVLVTGDHRGHFSHGLNRLDMYLGDIKKDLTNLSGVPCILKETVSTALVDGNNLLGPVVGNFAMHLAIEKARDTGIGWVAARESNHYGIAGYYALQAVRRGLIGFSFTNTSPLAVPTRSKQAATGTNAFCVMAPASNGDYFALDMATTTVAIGKVELAMRKNQQVPPVWGVCKDGKETTDPAKIYHGGSLLPIAGLEATGGYKGYGLNVLVEIFCGILADAAFGPLIRAWNDPVGQANLGQCFAAIDPSCFGNHFQDRLQAFLNILRNLEPVDPNLPVLVAGDTERMHMAKCAQMGGIPYHVNQIRHAEEVAASLRVEPLKVKNN